LSKVRIIFSTDVHGSEMYWRKWMKSAEYYKADVIIMAGDLTGKAIIPIIKKDNEYIYTFQDKKYTLHSEDKVEEACNELRLKGFYPFICTLDEVKELQKNKKKLDELFDRLMVEGIERWMKLVEENVDKNVEVIVNPGNDDIFEIDDAIKNSERVIYPLEKVVTIGGKYEMITCEWVNPTPWDSPRECSEEELMKKIRKETDRLSSYENALFNLHAPPYNTHLDIAPALDKSLRQKTTLGTPVMDHVGSTAVRDIIEELQPLMGLHGHIHESAGSQKIGRTICLNPGSKYTAGIFSAYIIDLTPEGVKYWPASEI